MVDLVTVKRVLALDLRMSSSAIEEHLAGQGWPPAADAAEVPLAEALRIVAAAEVLVPLAG